jgi:hypothetical protein
MSFGELPADIETEPGARNVAKSRLVGPMEALENPLAVVLRNPGAVIGDPHEPLEGGVGRVSGGLVGDHQAVGPAAEARASLEQAVTKLEDRLAWGGGTADVIVRKEELPHGRIPVGAGGP